MWTPGQPGERGGLAVRMGAPEAEGTTGVIAQVFTLFTGAAAANGFHGIGRRFVRHGLLRYAAHAQDGSVHRQRRDTGAAVRVRLDLSSVAPPPACASAWTRPWPRPPRPQQRAFGQLWQGRVRRLLLEHADDPLVVQVEWLA
jgi:hypothetical protein